MDKGCGLRIMTLATEESASVAQDLQLQLRDGVVTIIIDDGGDRSGALIADLGGFEIAMGFIKCTEIAENGCDIRVIVALEVLKLLEGVDEELFCISTLSRMVGVYREIMGMASVFNMGIGEVWIKCCHEF